MKRLAMFAALLASTFALAACDQGPVRDDKVTCYNADGSLRVEDAGSVDRLGDSEIQVTRKDGSKSLYIMDCAVDWDAAAPVQMADD